MEHDWKGAAETAQRIAATTYWDRPHLELLARVASALASGELVLCPMSNLKTLVYMARTSGGTAGPDADLMKACEAIEPLLAAAPDLPEGP